MKWDFSNRYFFNHARR